MADSPPGLSAESAPQDAAGTEGPEREVAVPMVASAEEVLRAKRFDAVEPGELAQVHRLMGQLRIATPRRRTRRFVPERRGERIDLRRTLRGSLRTGGDPIRLARRRRRVVPRRLVMLLDISGSMEPYARAYLQFLSCAAGAGRNAEAFVFATRLTRVTRALRDGTPQRALQRAADAAPDWSSGTRIGDALHAFNHRHGRRGMARGAVVVILSDGWERGDPDVVGREMERLARLAHRVVWVNPRVAAAGFEPRAGGMAAALPHCDALVAGHTLDALEAVVAAIAADDDAAPRWAARRARARGGAVGQRHPRRPAARWRCPAATAPAAAAPPRDGRDDPARGPDLHLPRLRAAGGAAARAGRPAVGLLRPRGPQRADRPPGARAPCQRGEEPDPWLTRPTARCSCACTRPARWC